MQSVDVRVCGVPSKKIRSKGYGLWVMGYGLWVMGKSEKCWCITVLGGGLGVVEDVALGLKCQDDMKCPVDIKY
jgi:hypothetical protein